VGREERLGLLGGRRGVERPGAARPDGRRLTGEPEDRPVPLRVERRRSSSEGGGALDQLAGGGRLDPVRGGEAAQAVGGEDLDAQAGALAGRLALQLAVGGAEAALTDVLHPADRVHAEPLRLLEQGVERRAVAVGAARADRVARAHPESRRGAPHRPSRSLAILALASSLRQAHRRRQRPPSRLADDHLGPVVQVRPGRVHDRQRRARLDRQLRQEVRRRDNERRADDEEEVAAAGAALRRTPGPGAAGRRRPSSA
jgi:hypothetical protein